MTLDVTCPSTGATAQNLTTAGATDTDKMAAAVREIANLKDKVAVQEAYIAELENRLDRSRRAMERRRNRTGGDIGPLDD